MDGPIPQTKQATVDWCDIVSVRLINDNYRFNTCTVSPTLKAPAYDQSCQAKFDWVPRALLLIVLLCGGSGTLNFKFRKTIYLPHKG